MGSEVEGKNCQEEIRLADSWPGAEGKDRATGY